MTVSLDVPATLGVLVAVATLFSFLASKFVGRRAIEEKVALEKQVSELKAAEEKVSLQHEAQFKELRSDVTKLTSVVEELQRSSSRFTQTHHECVMSRHQANTTLERGLLEKLSSLQQSQERLAAKVDSLPEQLALQLQALQNTVEVNLRRELHG